MTIFPTCKQRALFVARGRKPRNLSQLSVWKTALAVVVFCVGTAFAVNPVPFVNQPLVPDAAAPGGAAFTLTVNGTGFVSGSVVLWNGSPRTTQFVSQGQLTAGILATDIAKAGTASVTVVSPKSGGGRSAVLFFPVADAVPSINFSRTDFPSTGGNVQVVTDDFNGDGKFDLAASTFYDGTVRVFLGNGDGTFTPAPSYSVYQAHALVKGDFNNDGIMDLAVGSELTPRVTILLGNGDGTFRQGGTFTVGSSGSYRLAVGDFNGDGNLDLATTGPGEDSYVSILLGKGDGTFQPHIDTEISGQTLCRLVAGDFNGDGHLDLAVESDGYQITILLGNGDGTFHQGSVIPFATYGQRSLDTADLNGDGKLDLVIMGSFFSSDEIEVMLGNGDGTFRSDGQYTTGLQDNLAFADFNGDGKLDLAIGTYYSATVSVFEGNGNGTFQTPPLSFAVGDGARGAAVADFNGDGRLDLAIGNQFADTISILLNNAAPPTVTLNPPSLTFAAQDIGTFSPAQTVTLKNTSDATLNIAKISRASNDFYQSNNCPTVLQPEASCTLSVIFTPTSGGTKSGFVTISDDAVGSPQKLLLKGTASGSGSIKLTLSPSAINFGDVAVGATSQPQIVTVSNVGTVAASFSPPFGFVQETPDCIFHHKPQCGTSLAPGASCDVTLTFTPRVAGTKTGQFLIYQGTHTVFIPLSGTGTP
jgi:hypothetical protein